MEDLLLRVEANHDIVNWSEERQNDFCRTFKNRVEASRYILLKTAQLMWEKAERLRFISAKHYRDITKGFEIPRYDSGGSSAINHLLRGFVVNHKVVYHDSVTVGDRTISSLDLVAQERAKGILSNLPPLSKAVAIIDAETAKKIDRKTQLEKDAERLNQELDEVCGVISMGDVDQTMTIGAFRQMVLEREAKRVKLMDRQAKIGEEGRKLEEEIAKKLYAGLPGLSEAVVSVIRNHIEQSYALETTGRRVEEQVKFGNSEAAVEILRSFEKDEVKVSEEVGRSFREALEKLKVATKKGSKPVRGLKSV